MINTPETQGRAKPVQRALKFVVGAVLGVLLLALTAFLAWPMRSPLAPNVDGYEVVRIYRHDFRAYTQGLIYDNGEFFESTGGLGASSLRRVHVGTGAVLQRYNLADQHFGEGLALVNGRLIQLTWQSQLGFVHDPVTLDRLDVFGYTGEGWGLAYDGEELAMSDGTAELRFLEPTTLSVRRQLTVTDANGPVAQLNELEYVEGEIWANIWQTDLIARISPESGVVIGYIDLSGLMDNWAWSRLWPRHTDVLNGIAYDPDTERIFVTGKLWPVLYELKRR